MWALFEVFEDKKKEKQVRILIQKFTGGSAKYIVDIRKINGIRWGSKIIWWIFNDTFLFFNQIKLI